MHRRVLVLPLFTAVLSGCGTYGTSAADYATRACDAYRETGRDPVASTGALDLRGTGAHRFLRN